MRHGQFCFESFFSCFQTLTAYGRQHAGWVQLLNFSFLEHDVLAHDWIVLPKFHLFSGCPGIFLRYVIKACVRRADQLYENCTWFRHDQVSGFKWCKFWVTSVLARKIQCRTLLSSIVMRLAIFRVH